MAHLRVPATADSAAVSSSPGAATLDRVHPLPALPMPRVPQRALATLATVAHLPLLEERIQRHAAVS